MKYGAAMYVEKGRSGEREREGGITGKKIQASTNRGVCTP